MVNQAFIILILLAIILVCSWIITKKIKTKNGYGKIGFLNIYLLILWIACILLMFSAELVSAQNSILPQFLISICWIFALVLPLVTIVVLIINIINYFMVRK